MRTPLTALCLVLGGLLPATAPAQGGATEEKSFAEQASELNARVLADPTDGRAWNDLGVLYANDGQFDIARDSFIRAVQTNPAEGDYHRNLGMAFSRLGDYDLAVAEFAAYRRFDKFGGKDYWRLIGQAQRRAGMLEAAKVTFAEGIAELGPDLSPELLRLVLAASGVAMEDGDEQASRDLLEKYAPPVVEWIRQHPDEKEDGRMEADSIVHNRVAVLVDDGKLLEQSGLPGEATTFFEQAYELAPDRLDLLPRLVDAYLKDGQEMKAKVATRLAREHYPDQAGTWIATAKVYEKTDQLEDAVQAYEKAFAIDSSVDDLRVAIGNLLMRLGRDAEAASYLRKGVDSANTKPEVVYNYAVSLMREKKYHAAIPSLRSVVQQLPEFGQAWLALAQCLQVTEQYTAAIMPYERAYALNPDPKLLFQAASCAQKGGQPAKAIDYYLATLQADPTYAKARYNLSLSYMDAGRYPEAVASFDTLMALEGPSYRAYYSQGLSYYYQKDYPKALESFELAMEIEETPNVLNNIGRVYSDMGNSKEALGWYEQAKQLKGGK